jgi:hypothetical protein
MAALENSQAVLPIARLRKPPVVPRPMDDCACVGSGMGRLSEE